MKVHKDKKRWFPWLKPPSGPYKSGPCDVCRLNPATQKCSWESFDAYTCGPCCTLEWKAAKRLLQAPLEKVVILIKSWWNPDTRETTLPQAYPRVSWEQIRVNRREEAGSW